MDDARPQNGTEMEPPQGEADQLPAPQKKWGFIAIAILAAGIAAFMLLQALAPNPGQVEREVLAPIVQVAPLSIVNGSLPVLGNGPVRPRAQVTLVAQVSGAIFEINDSLVTGGAFEKGDVLAQIDPRPYQAALDQALAERQARQSDLDFSERQLRRDQQLAQSGAASERRRDETLNQRDRAVAQITGLDAQIVMRSVDLERTSVTAPFDGRVFTESIDVGSVVQPGTEIARIYADDMFEIVIPLSDREAALIPGLWDTTLGPKANATATLPYRGHIYAWNGYVDRVEAGIDPDTRTIDVVVRIPNPTQPGQPTSSSSIDALVDPPPMLSGTYAAVEIEGLSLAHTLIPRSALRANDTIWLVQDDETLSVISVDVIQDQGTHIAIQANGLTDGESLILSELSIATDGLRVRAVRREMQTQ